MKQLELSFKKKQRHIAWVCVGTSALDEVPTWFYAFRTHDKANEFVDKACTKTHGMMWEIYPCELDEPDEALANFEQCLKEAEAAYVFDPSQPVAEFVSPHSINMLDEIRPREPRKPTAEEWLKWIGEKP